MRTLYHVTVTRYAPDIVRNGILPGQADPNWRRAGDGKPHGERAFVYAFTDRIDAVRWAAKMSWALYQESASGEIAIISFDDTAERWQEDESDPLSRAGSNGKWLKLRGSVDPLLIETVDLLTPRMLKRAMRGKAA